jgi:hypothetical protein
LAVAVVSKCAGAVKPQGDLTSAGEVEPDTGNKSL